MEIKKRTLEIFLILNVCVIYICFPQKYHIIVRYCCTIICALCHECLLLFTLEILVGGRYTKNAQCKLDTLENPGIKLLYV
jgi:hypothetical protein